MTVYIVQCDCSYGVVLERINTGLALRAYSTIEKANKISKEHDMRHHQGECWSYVLEIVLD